MQRLVLTIGCGALLIAMCARVESRPGNSSKKPKPTATREKSQDVKPAPSESETTDTSTAAEVVPVPQPSPDPGWEFSIAPYFFLPGLDGTVGVAGQTAGVNASFRDLFRDLDFAMMGQFEAHKGNWSILGDGMYMSLSGKKVTPSPLFSDIDVEVKETILEPAVAYRVLKAEGGWIDVLGGVRFWHVRTHIAFKPIILPLIDLEGSKNWADPIIGARGVANLSPRVFLTGRFDVGGFGVGSDFTGQAFGGVGFQVKPRVALLGGYRYLRADYVDEGFVFKTALSGILLGVKFKF